MKSVKNINVMHGDTQVHNTCNAKFLGLIIDITLFWKDHINQLEIRLPMSLELYLLLCFR
jgi:hypothetical protein